MTNLIEELRDEHRNIEKLLGVVEEELAVFDRGERPDFDIFEAVIDYFHEYPDRFHHPREDRIFAAIRARDPSLAGSIGDVEAEHRAESERLTRFAGVVADVLADQEIPREAFHRAAAEFVAQMRRHIAWEEATLFPAALERLTAEDWAAIRADIAGERDPVFGDRAHERFRTLAERILRWEKEAREIRQAHG